MLIDKVTITIKGGDGGRGAATFRRNAQTAKGGPNGGDGGNGGNIIFQGSHNVHDLKQFQFQKKFQASSGTAGAKNNLFGANATDLTIFLPLGTMITDVTTGRSVEIVDEKPIIAAQGGKGGKGNNSFKSAILQAPTFSEEGELGEEKEVKLELKLIAQMGLVGLPNAGKSSLLKAITNAQPKVANYPFTTLEPNLGVLDGITIADIPGLIEGASEGRGLGIQFLKHIEKTALLIHCIDITTENILETYQTVRNEFENYNEELANKPEIILLTKIDLVEDKKQIDKQKKKLQSTKRDILTFSIYDDKSIETFKSYCLTLLHT